MAIKPQIINNYSKRLIITFIVLFIASVVVAVWQGVDSKKTEEELNKQIKTLVDANKFSVTSNDIESLRKDIKSEFGRVTPRVRNKQTLKDTVLTITQALTGENTRFIQNPTISDNPNFPYGLQVIIQTNITIEPVGFAIVLSGEIGSFNFFIAGQTIYMSRWDYNKGNTLYFGFEAPAFSPENSLIVTILSKTQIRVIKFYKVHK